MRARELQCIHRKSGMLSLRFLLLCFSPQHKEASGEEGERRRGHKVRKRRKRKKEKKKRREKRRKMPVAAVPRVGRSSGKLDERGVSLNLGQRCIFLEFLFSSFFLHIFSTGGEGGVSQSWSKMSEFGVNHHQNQSEFHLAVEGVCLMHLILCVVIVLTVAGGRGISVPYSAQMHAW